MSMDQIHCGMLRLERLCQILHCAVYPFYSVREWWVVIRLANEGWGVGGGGGGGGGLQAKFNPHKEGVKNLRL